MRNAQGTDWAVEDLVYPRAIPQTSQTTFLWSFSSLEDSTSLTKRTTLCYHCRAEDTPVVAGVCLADEYTPNALLLPYLCYC